MNYFSDVRKLSLAGYNKEIKKQLISNIGMKAFKVVRDKREATSRDVSNSLNISIQHSSTVLNKLYKQLYLRRAQRNHESGGKEWYYFL